MSSIPSVDTLIKLQREAILTWKEQGLELSQQDSLLSLVEENHAFNYQLWQAEDRARSETKGPLYVYEAKREIDRCNQQRNNRMEAIDNWLFKTLNPDQANECPVHSETPGMMIDRLSILALKAYHMHQQCLRSDVDELHLNNCRQKWQLINAQLAQLADCLALFLAEIKAKTRTFKVYYQFKMYNDPKLNPVLYQGE